MFSDSANRVQISASSLHLVRLALGLNYFHFGYLKFYPDLSSAENLAGYTVQRLSLYWITPENALRCIAILECLIGCAFLFNVFLRWLTPLFIFHMIGTFLPLVLLPEICFKFVPLAPTMEGQYILKNLVLLSAGWMVLAPHCKFRRSVTTSPSHFEPEVVP